MIPRPPLDLIDFNIEDITDALQEIRDEGYCVGVKENKFKGEYLVSISVYRPEHPSQFRLMDDGIYVNYDILYGPLSEALDRIKDMGLNIMISIKYARKDYTGSSSRKPSPSDPNSPDGEAIFHNQIPESSPFNRGLGIFAFYLTIRTKEFIESPTIMKRIKNFLD